ncbi:leucyl/phenylalanyl-tRNA--protein transferase [Castellaniella sp.]|uniref:leucyl/phenylalanyl-tRNA--protein transferase n=1 Tax=Castellaniella sp. TaxID=1955812 RepID=UPI003562CD21
MKPIWVDVHAPLPDPLKEPVRDLVALGFDLSTARLREAYAKGLFPWFAPGDPVLWWSPDPRMVLVCADLHISRSLAKRVRQFDRPDGRLRVTLNLACEAVMHQCARRLGNRIAPGAALRGRPLPTQSATRRWSTTSTWITPDIIQAYLAWHRQGHVQSVEVWIDEQLAGGLYGVSLGRCFFGESMFSRVSDTSKVALAYLARHLQVLGVPWVDCQQETPHLARMGARSIPRHQFLTALAELGPAPMPHWGRGRLRADGQLCDEPCDDQPTGPTPPP